MFLTSLCTISIAILFALNEVQGHGMMLDPPGRSSRWRTNSSAPINYDDNGLFCGGFSIQWGKNGGKCGLCGDDYSSPRPRPNELGGKFGQGVITRNYLNSHAAHLGIKITTNHLGFFYFNLCNLDEFHGESEECFHTYNLTFADGNDKFYIGSASGWVNATIMFPPDLSCQHCVLRWNYQAGNNWGPCGNGTSAKGCGPQENFKGCADISIKDAGFDITSNSLDDVDDSFVDSEVYYPSITQDGTSDKPEEYNPPVTQDKSSVFSRHFCKNVWPSLSIPQMPRGRLIQCWYTAGFTYFQKPHREKKIKKISSKKLKYITDFFLNKT